MTYNDKTPVGIGSVQLDAKSKLVVLRAQITQFKIGKKANQRRFKEMQEQVPLLEAENARFSQGAP